MAEQSNAAPPQLNCPICGGPTESGHLAGDGVLQWLQGRPGFWKDTFSMGGSVGSVGFSHRGTLDGIRCRACRRIILEDS